MNNSCRDDVGLETHDAPAVRIVRSRTGTLLLYGGALLLCAAYRFTSPKDHAWDSRRAFGATGSGATVPGAMADLEDDQDDRAQRRAARHKMLEDYRVYARYPPMSRPIDAHESDSDRSGPRHLSFVPVVEMAGGPPSFYGAFGADKSVVFGGDKVTLTLQASRTPSATGAHIPITVTSASLAQGRSLDAPHVADFRLHDDGAEGDAVAGDAIYTAVIDPAATPGLRDLRGSVRASVSYSANGTNFGQQVVFDYEPVAGITGKLTGRFREAVEEGSLVVYAEMNVRESARYAIDADLVSAGGRPVCRSRFAGTLEAGTREIRFLFFGKVIRDAQLAAAGTFQVTRIVGRLTPESAKPIGLELGRGGGPTTSLYEGAYVTKKYALDAFSDEEWQSPAKDDELRALARAANEPVPFPSADSVHTTSSAAAQSRSTRADDDLRSGPRDDALLVRDPQRTSTKRAE